jgi:hypothetical protein
MVGCYVVCDSLEARIHATGMVVRRENGAVLGAASTRLRRHGGDTVRADLESLDSLRAGLRSVAARGLDAVFRQGTPPCVSTVTTHTPVITISWGDRFGALRLSYDVGCDESSGLLEATVRHAVLAARFHALPVRQY